MQYNQCPKMIDRADYNWSLVQKKFSGKSSNSFDSMELKFAESGWD